MVAFTFPLKFAAGSGIRIGDVPSLRNFAQTFFKSKC